MYSKGTRNTHLHQQMVSGGQLQEMNEQVQMTLDAMDVQMIRLKDEVKELT